MTPTTQQTRFEHLVHTHHAAVYRSARRVLRSDAAAEDVTQDVFLRVLTGRLAIEDDDEAVQRVLCWWSVHTALNERRTTARRHRREERHAMTRPEAFESASADNTRLWELVDELPDELRVPLVLRFGEELAFARIGELLQVAESTAHERVQRALARLRVALTSAGLVALAAALEARLTHGAPVAPPVGLATRLVGLESARASVSLALVASLAVGVLAVAGAAAWWFDQESSGSTELAMAALIDVDDALPDEGGGLAAPDNSDFGQHIAVVAVASSTDDEADPTTAAVLTGEAFGRVLDGDGSPLAGADVCVFSVERSGKFSAYGARAATAADGTFHVAVEVAGQSGGLYHAQVTRAGYSITTSEPLRIRAAATTDFGLVVAQAMSNETQGSYTLDIEVVDTFGSAVAGAVVELASVVELPVPPGTLWTNWYSRGGLLERVDRRALTDASGAAHFAADGGGAKLVRVKPKGLDLAPFITRFDVAADETAHLVLVAEPGGVIEGSITTVEGPFTEAMRGAFQIHVREELTSEWLFGELDDSGNFHVRGLPPGTQRVEIGTNGGMGAPEADLNWSPTSIDVALVSGGDVSSGHVVVLKRRDDTRDIGSHLGELHGHFVRAEDGQPQVVDFWDIDPDLAPDLDAAVFTRDWLPNHVFPGPAQRAAFGPIPDPSDVLHQVGLAAGSYLLRCTTARRASLVHGPIEIAERELRAGLVLVLEPAARIAGTVRSASGALVDGALVLVTGVGPISDEVVTKGDRELRASDGRGYLYVNGTEQSSKAGRFEIGQLPSGVEFRLVALHPDHAPAIGLLVTLTVGEQRDGVELRFAD